MNFPAAFLKRPDSHKLRYVIRYNRKSIAFRAAYLLSVIMAPELAILLFFWLRFFSARAVAWAPLRLLVLLVSEDICLPDYLLGDLFLHLSGDYCGRGCVPGPRLLLFFARRRRNRCRWWFEFVLLPFAP